MDTNEITSYFNVNLPQMQPIQNAIIIPISHLIVSKIIECLKY